MINETKPDCIHVMTTEPHAQSNNSMILLHDQTNAAAYKGVSTPGDISFQTVPKSIAAVPSDQPTRAFNSRNSTMPSNIGNTGSLNNAVGV